MLRRIQRNMRLRSVRKKRKRAAEKVPMILRDVLAVDRTRLANQRTVLSFFRTGLSLVVTALAIFEFKQGDIWYMRAAWAMIGLGIAVMIAGFISYFATKRSIKKSYRKDAASNNAASKNTVTR